MKTQEQRGCDDMPPEAVMSTSQLHVRVFLRDSIGQTTSYISENVEYLVRDVEKIIEMLL